MTIVFLGPDAFDNRFEFFKARGGTNRLWRLYSAQMSSGRARDDSIAQGHFENLFDARHVQIVRVRSEAVTGNPMIDMRRLNFGDLSKPAVRPLVFYPVNDERFSLDG